PLFSVDHDASQSVLLFLSLTLLSLFFSYCPAVFRYVHSFPTRRSSDLQYRLSLRALSRGHVRAVSCVFYACRKAGSQKKHKKRQDRKSTRLNSSHGSISYAVFCLKKKKHMKPYTRHQPPKHQSEPSIPT